MSLLKNLLFEDLISGLSHRSSGTLSSTVPHSPHQTSSISQCHQWKYRSLELSPRFVEATKSEKYAKSNFITLRWPLKSLKLIKAPGSHSNEPGTVT